MLKWLTLALALAVSPAYAQNTTCANRPAGNSSNACANTRFVGTAYTNLLATINTWTAQQQFGSSPKFLTLTGYVKANGASVATASATVPIGDLSGLGTGVATALGNNLEATSGLAAYNMAVANPTLSSCGIGSSVDARSGNTGGKVTFGIGSTTCTVSFANAYPNAAFCTITPTVQPAAVANIPFISSISKNGFTISGGTATQAYLYACRGN